VVAVDDQERSGVVEVERVVHRVVAVVRVDEAVFTRSPTVNVLSISVLAVTVDGTVTPARARTRSQRCCGRFS
jgi:hypothetical protein